MILEQQRPIVRSFRLAGAGRLGHRLLPVNGHPVVEHGDDRVGRLMTFRGPAGRGEVDIVGLPALWREAHVQEWELLAIECRATVDHGRQTERVEDLHFVAPLDVDAAVTARLASGLGQERSLELEVQAEVADRDLGHGAGCQPPFGCELAGVKPLDARSVEQHDCVIGRRGP